MDHNQESPNEIWRAGRRTRLLRLLAAAAGGAAFAGALPPLNWYYLAFAAPALLVAAVIGTGWRFALLAGWIWGVCWAFPAFRFLREIDPAVPFLMAPVLGVWTALFAAPLPALWRDTVFPVEVELAGAEAKRKYLDSGKGFFRLLLFAAGTAALFTLLEWSRSRMLPWNELGTTMWSRTDVIQLAAVTGSYGVSFLVAFTGAGIGCAFLTRFRGAGLRVLAAATGCFALISLGGAISLLRVPEPQPPNWRPALLQGDLSQRRNAVGPLAEEALDIYLDLTGRAIRLDPPPDIILWPESAVPVPFRAAHPTAARFRRAVAAAARESGIPLLIGAACVYMALAALLVRGLTGKKLNGRAGLAVSLLAALVIRVLLAFTVEGYGVDMGCFGAWAGKMADGGPANFYEAGYFCDYPPAYMLVLWLLGLLGRALGLGTGSMAFQGLMKLVPIACDLALAAVCFKWAEK